MLIIPQSCYCWWLKNGDYGDNVGCDVMQDESLLLSEIATGLLTLGPDYISKYFAYFCLEIWLYVRLEEVVEVEVS